MYYLLKWIKLSVKKKHYKIMEDGGKYWKRQGTLLVRKSGNHGLFSRM